MKQSVTITGVWLRNFDPDKSKPEVLLEISGKWHQVLSPSDIAHHVSMIRECRPEHWPIDHVTGVEKAEKVFLFSVLRKVAGKMKLTELKELAEKSTPVMWGVWVSDLWSRYEHWVRNQDQGWLMQRVQQELETLESERDQFRSAAIQLIARVEGLSAAIQNERDELSRNLIAAIERFGPEVPLK